MTRKPDYRKAAETANRVLVRLRTERLPVRPMDMLRRCRNTRLYTYDQAAEALGFSRDELERLCGGTDAITIRSDDDRRLVCYRAGGNPARLNFTLAHELGHIALHHTGNSRAEEAEADCFASHLLCPDAVIANMDDPTPDRLARLCYISRTAAEQALNRKERCIHSDVYRQIEKYIGAYIRNGERHVLDLPNERE